MGLVEAHHVAGRNHDAKLTSDVCLRCHAELTEAYRDAGAPMLKQASFPETLIAMLTALAVFFRELADAFMRWAAQIRAEGLKAQ